MSFKEAQVQGLLRKRAGDIEEVKYVAKGIAEEYYDDESEMSWSVSRVKEEESFGFSDKVFDEMSSFQVKKMNLSLGQLKIKCLAVSLKSVVAITEENQVLRWIFDNVAFEKYEVITIAEKAPKQLRKLGGKIADVGGKFIPRFKQFQTNKQIEKERRKEIERIFFDRQGNHCVLSNNFGHSYYLSHDSSKMRFMQKMKRYIIKSLEFDERVPAKSVHSDKVFLFGSEENQIFEGKLEFAEKEGMFVEAIPELRIQVKEEKPKNICDIKIHTNKYVEQAGSGRKQLSVVIASSTSAIYFFSKASPSSSDAVSFQELFAKYEELDTFLFSLPTPASHLSYSDVCLEYSNSDTGSLRSCSYLYTNGNYLQYYKFPERKDTTVVDDNFFRSVNYFNYGKLPTTTASPSQLKVLEMPIGVGITLHHYVILHSDSVSVLSQITQQVVFHENLTYLGKIIGMVNDMENNFYWIYGESKVIRLQIKNEIEASWRLYVEKGMYEKAYSLCKKAGSDYLPRLAEIYGDQLFEQGKYVKAAQIYLESNLSFEEVFVKFVETDERVKEGLASYVNEFLHSNEQQLLTFHRVILVNWLAEYYIHKASALQQRMNSKRETVEDAKVLAVEARRAKESLKMFMDANKKSLVDELMYELLSSYGELEQCLSYALEKQNYQMVLSNYILSERYEEAIKVMKSMTNCSEFAHKYSDTLMKNQTVAFLDLLKTKVPRFEPAKIMRSLMEIDKQSESFDDGFSFIQFCVKDERLRREGIVHNIYVFLLSEHKDRKLFTKFIHDEEKKVLAANRSAFTAQIEGKAVCNFDINFAFNLAKAHKFDRVLISIYGIQRQFEEAVNLAIQTNDIPLAIAYAKMQEESLNFDSKKLSMKVIDHLIKNEKEESKKIEKIFNVLEECHFVKIEDLIPYFDQNMPLELFKGKIEESVREYKQQIVALKEEMEKQTVSMDELKVEFSKISNKHLVITEQHTCRICSEPLLSSDFLAYPCDHNVHKACVIDYISKKQIYDLSKLHDIDSLQEKIMEFRKNVRSYDRSQLKSSVEFYADIYRTYNKKARLLNGGTPGSAKKASKYLINFESDIHKLSLLHKALDKLVSEECPICGVTLASLASSHYQSDPSWDTL